MMQDSTKKRRGAIICAAIMVGLLGACLALCIFPLLSVSYGEAVAVGFLVIYGLVIVAVIIGVLAALRQRLREIEGGEEDDAKQY